MAPSGGALYDQAVIRISFDSGATPVALLGSDSISAGESFDVFGYGLDEKGNDVFTRLEAGEYSSLLKAGKMIVKSEISGGLVFTALFDSTGESACFGDSGGPAIVKRNGVSAVGGIVSFGSIGDCQAGSFAAFGNVGNSANLRWIRGQVPEALVLN
jgi:hypothetical protein